MKKTAAKGDQKRLVLVEAIAKATAHELYIHRAVGRPLPRIFFREYEQRMEASHGGNVAFRFLDVVYFCACAAASGVVGNLTYAALVRAVRAVRRPQRELGNGDAQLEIVVSRLTYNRVLAQRHPGKKAASEASSKVEKELETQYELIVTKRTPPAK